MDKTFFVKISTDSPNNIDAREIHLALVRYFVAYVGIEVKEAAQHHVQADEFNGHAYNCGLSIGGLACTCGKAQSTRR